MATHVFYCRLLLSNLSLYLFYIVTEYDHLLGNASVNTALATEAEVHLLGYDSHRFPWQRITQNNRGTI
jgi:hypothetical protein